MEYYVYILYSPSKDKHYIGYSSDPDSRLQEHNLGATTSTRHGRPWILVHRERYHEKSLAIMREIHLKKMKSRKYIEDLIRNSNPG